MPTTTRQWLLNGHPRGRGIADDDFKLVETALPDPGPGEMLIRTRWLGFDPAQKGWMENIADYVAPMAIGDVMRGSGIGEVIASNGGRFGVGDMVFGTTGWTEYLVSDGRDLNKVETGLAPTAVLSVLGTTGLTAYCGLFKVGRPLAGDTVLVSIRVEPGFICRARPPSPDTISANALSSTMALTTMAQEEASLAMLSSVLMPRPAAVSRPASFLTNPVTS